jgi:hypothetical protein
MTPDELKATMDYLSERVILSSEESKNPVQISFQIPTEDEMIEAGLNKEILSSEFPLPSPIIIQ